MSTATDKLLHKVVDKLFLLCDSENNGFINKRDLQKFGGLKNIDPEKMEELFSRIDKDRKGFVTHNDILILLQETDGLSDETISLLESEYFTNEDRDDIDSSLQPSTVIINSFRNTQLTNSERDPTTNFAESTNFRWKEKSWIPDFGEDPELCWNSGKSSKILEKSLEGSNSRNPNSRKKQKVLNELLVASYTSFDVISELKRSSLRDQLNLVRSINRRLMDVNDIWESAQ